MVLIAACSRRALIRSRFVVNLGRVIGEAGARDVSPLSLSLSLSTGSLSLCSRSILVCPFTRSLSSGEDVFDLLSPEQKKDFLRALEDGRISSELPLWSPWWTAEVFISEMRGEGRGGAGAAPITEGAPPIPASLPPLSTLTKQPPSPLLIYNLADILYAYALVMRLSNGEWQPEPGEAASDVVRLSAVLSGNAVFQSLQEALNSSLATAVKVRSFSLFPLVVLCCASSSFVSLSPPLSVVLLCCFATRCAINLSFSLSLSLSLLSLSRSHFPSS